MQGWNYQARAKEVEDAQSSAAFALLEMRKPRKIEKPKLQDPHATNLQLELFQAIPTDHYYWVENLLEKLPSARQKEHFRKLYLDELKAVQDDGSIAFAAGNKQLKAANSFLLETIEERLGKVFAQYKIDLEILSQSLADKWSWACKHSAANGDIFQYGFAREHDKGIQTDNKKGFLPFYLIPDDKLERLGADIAFIFKQKQNQYFLKVAKAFEMGVETSPETILDRIYYQCGSLCESIGFPFYYWESYKHKKDEEEKPNQKNMEIALNMILDAKYWLKTFRKIQMQLVEHLRIACGEVCKNKSAYVSKDYLRFYDIKQAKGLDFLRNSILVNIDDEEEQIALFEMWFKSNSNPEIRRTEMMNRLRGLERWAEKNGYTALFLTLTAPSSFHAVHQNGQRNRKWQGASPRQTQAYLNKVWAEFRALLKKRGIDFKGMRVAEPHHDATPHWHILFYCQTEHIEEVTLLFKEKALELDGDEKGAAEHRCKVEMCDKTKGSATAYIAKYIAKNIGGFADFNAGNEHAPELDLGIESPANMRSDEDSTLKSNQNARRVKAWAGLWGIRQFQFFGAGSVTVWRELRRLGDEAIANDEQAESARAVANDGDYESFLELQAGGNIRNAAIKPYYETTEEGKYGQLNKKIKGIYNSFKQLAKDVKEFILTRKKQFKIVKGTLKRAQSSAIEANEAAQQAASEAAALNTGRSPAWTCVNNCNLFYPEGREINSVEKLENFLKANPQAVKRLENALILQQIPQRFVNDYKKMRLLEGGSIQLHGQTYAKFNGVEMNFYEII